MKPRLVLFDLDGTLADTAPDIARVINLVLAEEGRPPLALEAVRSLVSFGARQLLRSGFDEPLGDSRLARLQERLFDHYADNPVMHTAVFPGLSGLIGELAEAGICWGIVSNKPERLVRPIVSALALPFEPVCVTGGDTFDRKKPDPLPLIEACRLADIPIHEACYVGDAVIDAQAARAAGIPLIIAGYGYAPPRAVVREWGTGRHAADVDELAKHIGLHRPASAGVT